MNVLFWNVNKKNNQLAINDLVNTYDIDLLILAESNMSDLSIISAINNNSKMFNISSSIGCKKIKIYTHMRLRNFLPKQESKRWTIRKVTQPAYPNFLLVAAHLGSKINFDNESQLLESVVFKESIDKAINDTCTDKVLVVGDLNMNPFEPGIISSKGLNATIDRRIARKKTKRVQGVTYNYLYNPMWNFLGDESTGSVPGTHYYNSSGHIDYKWNIFDHVLLSPDMIDNVPNKQISIITNGNKINLIKSNGQINNSYSDHLPVLIKINSSII